LLYAQYAQRGLKKASYFCFGGSIMAVSYNKLWKLLIDKGINKTKLRNATNMSSSTMAKLTKNQPVAMPVLEKICAELECNIEDIMEFNKLDEVKHDLQQKEVPPDESIQ
jgi:DNA-binding Xre family transcriptional regulator